MGAPQKPSLRQVLGANVRRARNGLGWTQEKLWEKSGITQTTISQIESGVYAATVDTIEKLAGAMDVTEDLLLRRN